MLTERIQRLAHNKPVFRESNTTLVGRLGYGQSLNPYLMHDSGKIVAKHVSLLHLTVSLATPSYVENGFSLKMPRSSTIS